MMCLTCQWKLGIPREMKLEGSVYHCDVCNSTRISPMAAPVLTVRSGISQALYIGGFMLLLLATVVFTAFPELEISLTWTALYSLYLVYFGLAFANFRRHIYV